MVEEGQADKYYTITELSPCSLKLSVRVPYDKVKERINKHYDELKSTINFPGFRVGHVPLSLLEKRFGKSVTEAVKLELIEEIFKKAVEENKLDIIYTPALENEQIKLDPGSGLSLEFEVKVKPKINVENYIGIKVKKEEISIPDEELEKTMGMLKELIRLKSAVIVSDRGSKENDLILANISLFKNKEAFEQNKPAYESRVAVIPLVPADFKSFFKRITNSDVPIERFYGLRKKMEEIIKLGDADDGEIIRLFVVGVCEPKETELNDALAKELGYNDLSDLRQSIKEDLLEAVQKEYLEKKKDEIATYLLQTNNFTLPDEVIDYFKEDAKARMFIRLQGEGMREEEIEEYMRVHESSLRKSVENGLKLSIILENIAKKERIFATEDDINKHLNDVAFKINKPFAEVKEYYEKNNLITRLRSYLRDEKVLDFLLEKAEFVEDVSKE